MTLESKMGSAAAGAGFMVLGMHRSGTSALAHALQMAGADPGRRVLGASRGNEEGHWEDAFAVELHERLLARFGARWSEPFALPVGWRQHEDARAACATIARYLRDDRAEFEAWVVKDPRMCLFGGLWRDAARAQSAPLSAIVLLRHPLEVADSLAARDGIGTGSALLLWLDYTLSALRVAQGMPSLLLSYDRILDDWEGCGDAIASLPGGHALDLKGTGPAINAMLRTGLRHHRREGVADLPACIARLWRGLQEEALPGSVAEDTVERLAPGLCEIEDLLRLYAGDVRHEHGRLWERVGRAEALVESNVLEVLPAEIGELRLRIDDHHQDLVAAFSNEVRAMQEAHAEALAAAERVSAEAELGRGLAGRLDELKSSVEDRHQGLGDAMAVKVEAVADEMRAARSAFASEVVATRQQLQTAIEGMQRSHEAATAAREDARRAGEALLAARSESEANAELAARATARAEAAEQAMLDAQRRASDADEAVAEARRRASAAEDAVAVAQRRALDADQAAAAARRRTSRAEQDLADARRRIADVERDLAALGCENERLRASAATLQQVLRSRSWRLTRPLRALARALAGNWTPDSSEKLRRALASKLPPLLSRTGAPRHAGATAKEASAHDIPPAPRVEREPGNPLAPQDELLPDVFVWSVIDWNFRTQRPQHLARALARKGHRVFYISNNFVDSEQPGFAMLPLDDEGRLFQLNLHLAGAPQIYFAMPSPEDLERLHASLARVLQWTSTWRAISIVQHPYWTDLATMVPSPRLVYDCMDHHAGFENNGSAILRAEAELTRRADLVIVTSDPLQAEVEPVAHATAVIRNAADYTFFASRPPDVYSAPGRQQVIGYFGAIAEWFDTELVRNVALRYPASEVVLVGADTVGVAEALADLSNVKMVGEVPYSSLPYWVHAFDVCLLPFERTPLTEATNPVKVYEYLAAGKAVVSVDLPELTQFGDVVEVAADADSFVAAVGAALANPSDPVDVGRRQAFANGQTWADRAEKLDHELRRLPEPRVSVVVLTYNNLELTKACLSSIETYSDYANLELLVVDNASSDGSQAWLQGWAKAPSRAGHDRRLILNDSNLGFSAGNNVGLRASSGDVLVILNNDTFVTPGWVRTLCAHLARDPALGLVGPVTNNIGNEARVEIAYSSMEEMITKAGELTRASPGREVPLETAAFFCVAMPRRVYEAVGDLDEAFGVGFFEDDDYCRRVAQAGFRIACAEDVFVHHHLSASFNKLPTPERQALFERNKATYEKKWGAWKPHVYRPAKSAGE